jgi:high-affinity iron transporter
MLSTFLIALREGLEAALIVGILVAYVVKTERRFLLAPIWSGVGLALAASLALGGFLTFTSAELSERGEQFFAGTTSFLAVGLVTWMVFWMKRAAKTLRDELHGRVDNALSTGPLALAAAAFFAVAREGLETSLFVYTNFRTVSATSAASIGLILGLTLAVVLGYLIYNRSIRLNLSKFFTVTGVFLIIVAAGVLSYGIHEYQELGWIPGDGSYAWDISSVMAKDSIAGSLLAGTIGFDVNTTWVQLIFWAAYLTVILRLYTQSGNRSDKRSNNSAAVSNAR